MNERYEAFCMASPLFYDTLHAQKTADGWFPTADRPLPGGWRRVEQDDWLVFAPPELDLPMQGWKIHVSACLDNAERVLDAVWDYCVPRGIEFKFLRSEAALWLRSSKYAPRGYSGKLVTIYPRDDAACETMLRELGAVLDGEPGPYILSDLRWGTGPLHVRYGGFAPLHCVDEAGQVVLAIADDTGKLVPDRRTPVFHVPPWLTLPDFLVPHLAARNAVTVADLPYTIESVLHFSNGGGIYRGKDTRSGAEVVLKEGRPHAGLDGTFKDAVSRVEREYEMLQRLAGIPGIPKVGDLFWVGEHRFLSMEYVDGVPLNKALVRRYPLIDQAATPDDFAAHTEWALDIYRQVETAILAMHERGVVYGDLHMFNVVVRSDDTVALLDFEVASTVEENTRPPLGNQGFAAPRTVTGVDVDRYGLACLRLALFLPMTAIVWLSRPKARQLADVIREHFPVPDGFLDEAVDTITALGATTGPQELVRWDTDDWPYLREQMAKAILATATPERDDRLFPGDIEQFRLGGLGLAYGAAGVLYALDVAGAGRHPQLEEWLLRQAKQPPPGTLLGLYDGMHGVAFTLDHLGYRQEALDALDLALNDDWSQLGLDLIGGLSGIGLSLAHFAERTGEPGLRQALNRAVELVAERLGDVESVAETSGLDHPYAGLFRGSSGPALLFLRMYDATGDEQFLDRAAVALRQDLRRCLLRDNGVMEVNEGWRTMPYLGVGSVGIGFALDEYLARRDDDQFADASRAIHGAALSRMYVQPGVYAGRAGMLLYLAGRTERPLDDPDVVAQLRRLSWHTLPLAGGIAFPGDALLRLSMDLATGTAGVLLAVAAACHDTASHDEPAHLPLLAPSARTRQPQSPASPRRGLVSNTL
ncbi:class III lanthionine synthetase LanKC [Planosporangium mesophilum]|nr:class III lanthionine synthetase LanKC [Planosporangium mesophilum]NJC84664.1 protein kinase/lanthionine synthetase C family protein [Planosporangium mesophilum]